MTFRISHIAPSVFCLAVCILSFLTLANYPGRMVFYIVFTVALNALFMLGFSKERIFFDTFIGIFFWLGFWLKFSVRMAFMDGKFQEPVGNFNGTAAAFDRALLVTSCGVIALLVASFARRKFFSSYKNVTGPIRLEGVFALYINHKKLVLTLFSSLFVTVALANLIFGIYQRGSVPRAILPFGLSGVYTWLLLFGLASISAVILDCEFRMKKNPYLVSFICLSECFFSNVSMLSRGMILNGGSLIIGLIDNARRRFIDLSLGYKLIISVIFVILFTTSVFAVNHIRKGLFFSCLPVATPVSTSAGETVGPISSGENIGSVRTAPREAVSMMFLPEPFVNTIAGIKILLIDRWVGIEGVMAVSSYQRLGWDLWKRAWQERYLHSGTSMFDRTILKYEYLDIHLSRYHFINLPGILAFFYYPGSFIFLFVSMLLLGFIGAGIEISIYKLSGGNIIFCSLIAQVVAYRYAHFGYVPYQSYLLFGSIYLNVLLVFFLNKSLLILSKRSISS